MKPGLAVALLLLTGCASRTGTTGPDRLEFSAHGVGPGARGWGEVVALTYDIALSRDGGYRLAVADDPAPALNSDTGFRYSVGEADSLAAAVWALLPDAALADSLPVRPPGVGNSVVAVVEGGRRRFLVGGTAQEIQRLLLQSPGRNDVGPGEPFEIETRAAAWPPPFPETGS